MVGEAAASVVETAESVIRRENTIVRCILGDWVGLNIALVRMRWGSVSQENKAKEKAGDNIILHH